MKMRGDLTKLLVFAFVTIMLTALLARTIHGFQAENARTYVALFTDATRLQPGDDVRLAGVAVGRVSSVELDDAYRARVAFTVDDSVELTDTSTVVIRYRNLIGERYLALDVPDTGQPLSVDEVIPLARTRPALDLTAVFNGFRPLFRGLDSDAVNSLSMSLVKALQGEGGTIASLLSGTGSLGQTIAEHDQTIGQLVTDLTTVLNEVNAHSGAFNRLVEHLATFTRDLAGDRNDVLDALAAIDRLAQASATVVTAVRPGLRSTIDGLGSLASGLDESSDELSSRMELLPVKLNALLRTAQYGSWFQFYSCGMSLQVDLPTGQSLQSPAPPTRAPICGG